MKKSSGFVLLPWSHGFQKPHVSHIWFEWVCSWMMTMKMFNMGVQIYSSLFRKLPVVSKFQTVAWRCRYVTSNFYVRKTIGESIRWMFGPIWYDLNKSLLFDGTTKNHMMYTKYMSCIYIYIFIFYAFFWSTQHVLLFILGSNSEYKPSYFK